MSDECPPPAGADSTRHDELLDELRQVATEVAGEVAALVLDRRRGTTVEVSQTKTSPIDVVTAVDTEAEAMLRALLDQRRPDDGFLGEEGGRQDSDSGITWVVDPIDGTVNYLYDLPHYAVSVAAVDAQERSLAGAVVNVVSGEVFSAARGHGATLDSRPIRVREVAPMSQRLVLTGFSYERRIRALQGPSVARMLLEVRDIRRNGSAALELCSIAAGRADAYVEECLHLWDRAAAGLIADEAGARTEVHRGAGGMDLVVCAPASGFEDFFDLVQRCAFTGSGTSRAVAAGSSP